MKENQTDEVKAVVLHDSQPVSLAEIQARIYTVRNIQVMIDRDLALLYGVENRALKQAVRRNLDKFPDDFMLRLTENESNQLISSGVSQIVIPPGYNTGGTDMFAFTEQGVAMLATVLKSQRATDVSVQPLAGLSVAAGTHQATEMDVLRATGDMNGRANRNEVVENFDHLQNLRFSHQPPKAFTEKGLYMLTTILKSPKAVCYIWGSHVATLFPSGETSL